MTGTSRASVRTSRAGSRPRRPRPLPRAAEEARARRRSAASRCGETSPASTACAPLAAQVANEALELHVLVHNAGVLHSGRIDNTTPRTSPTRSTSTARALLPDPGAAAAAESGRRSSGRRRLVAGGRAQRGDVGREHGLPDLEGGGERLRLQPGGRAPFRRHPRQRDAPRLGPNRHRRPERSRRPRTGPTRFSTSPRSRTTGRAASSGSSAGRSSS